MARKKLRQTVKIDTSKPKVVILNEVKDLFVTTEADSSLSLRMTPLRDGASLTV
jgi:hypothetical protein